MNRAFLSLLNVLLALSSSAWVQDPIFIGVCLPLTGNLGHSTQSVWQGIKIAHKMCPRVQGRSVLLKVADTKSEMAEAANAVFRLTRKEKVVALIGDRPAVAITNRGQAEKTAIPVISPAASRLSGGRGNDSSNASCFESDLAIMANNLGLGDSPPNTAAIVYDIAHEDSLQSAASFRSEFVQAGGRILFESRIKTGDRDFIGQISQINKMRPQVVYAPIEKIERALMIRQARDMGLNTPIKTGYGKRVPKQERQGSESVRDFSFTDHLYEVAGRSDIWGKFRDLCEKEVGEKPQEAHYSGARAYLLIMEAIQISDSTDPEEIRQSLSRIADLKG